jgi:hypothetical protein
VSRVSVKAAEKLSELLTDVEDAFSRASDAVSELMDSETRGEDRDSDALEELSAAVNALRGKRS